MSDSVIDNEAARRELVFQDGSSNKFWNIVLEGSAHTVTFGKTGTQGQTQKKEFESPAAARKSFDKLVAEKSKKGYVDANGSTATKSVAVSGKPSPLPKVAVAEAPASTTPVAASLVPLSPVWEAAKAPAAKEGPAWNMERRIDLEPADWARATFRRQSRPDRMAPTKFDREECLHRLGRLRVDYQKWNFRWSELGLAMNLSPEEAGFWFAAMNLSQAKFIGADELRPLLTAPHPAESTDVAAVVETMRSFEHCTPPELAPVLYGMLGPDKFIELLAGMESQLPAGHQQAYQRSARSRAIRSGFQTYCLANLSDGELTAMQQAVRQQFDPTLTSGPIDALPILHYFAAMLGMHEEVAAITSRWPDDAYARSSDGYHRPQEIVLGLGSPEEVAAAWRRLKLKMRSRDDVAAFLACAEYLALDCVADSVIDAYAKDPAEELLKMLARVQAPENAAPMLRCKLHSKAPSLARAWLDQNPAFAAAGLIAVAGGSGELADAAIEHLRNLKRIGYVDNIRALLDETTDPAARTRAQTEVIDMEEIVLLPLDESTTPAWLTASLAAGKKKRSVQRPGWSAPQLLPPLPVDARCLNDEQMRAVIEAIATTALNVPHPLLAAIRENIAAPAREHLAWTLFTAWEQDGAPPKERWAMGAIGHIGGEECIDKLMPLIRAWPADGKNPRAVFGLECLRAIGSERALAELANIAQKFKSKGLRTKAQELMAAIAADQGLSRADLEDRIVPHCGLDEHGRREFDFGTRSFSFVLGRDLKPMLRDIDGKLKGDLPKPGAKDDASKAEAAIAEWKRLKKQIKDVASLQSSRLEQSMTSGRRWRSADFETYLVRHPLLRHLVRQLIWAAYADDGSRIAAFRITDESDYADVRDATLPLAGGVSVGIVHPLELTVEEKSAWGEAASDYEIVAPFPQLGRPVYSLQPGEENDDALKRFHGLKLDAPTMVFTLDRFGWMRGAALDGGHFDEHAKPFPAANVTAVIQYEETAYLGFIDPGAILTIARCQFFEGMRKLSGYNVRPENPLPLRHLPAIVISEVIADLQALASKRP